VINKTEDMHTAYKEDEKFVKFPIGKDVGRGWVEGEGDLNSVIK
jgi:hypothetical protein